MIALAMNNFNRLSDPSDMVALVTGANRGIGRAYAERLARAGARVYAGARDVSTLASLAAELPNVTPIQLDVTDRVSIEAAAARCSDINLLVNNAGSARPGGVTDSDSTDGARAEMDVNYFGMLEMTRAFAPILTANSPSAIVNVLSILSLIGFPRIATYSASKAAALSATRAIRAELAPKGVRVVGVMPGFVDTDMTQGLNGEKITTGDVVDATLAALTNGDEDVYPGAQAAQLAQGFFSDHKSLEKQLAQLTF
jgi:NAD(P)-dependent dehydrogenase (short-subunit alcohol dehydrogenase family)